jgi:DNA-directed RNA polymerase specialized sigma subunit
VVAVTKIYEVRAKHWAGGWELHIDQVGVTQVRTLDRAERQVRDYLETLLDLDVSDAVVKVIPDLGGLEEQVRKAKEQSRAAEAAQRKAAQETRKVAVSLRNKGLSVSDTAKVMGVSRGRISQLVKAGKQPVSARQSEH